MIFSTLNNLTKGGVAQIYDLEARGDMRRRLLDLGIIPGTRTKCLFTSAKGAISAYLFGDTVIALRRDDAKKIVIVPLGVKL